MTISAQWNAFKKNLMNVKKSIFDKKDKERQEAIQVLLNRGESDAHAQLIIAAIEEWELDYSVAATLDFKVVGQSVWINQED